MDSNLTQNLSSNIKSKRKIKINLKLFNIVLYFIIFVSGVYYVVGANELSIKGFSLADLKGQARNINDSNKKLEAQMIALSSFNNVNEKIKKLDMVAVKEVEYVANTGGTVAVRE